MRISILGLAAAALMAIAPAGSSEAQQAPATRAIEIGPTGFAVKRPVLAASCRECPIGEVGIFVREAMAREGWDVVVCANCNLTSTALVAHAQRPPPLDPEHIRYGVIERFDAPVDFGVTTSERLAQAYQGGCGSQLSCRNLRLIARIEHPFYLLAAAKTASGITDLSQILRERRPVTIVVGGAGSAEVLAHYGLTKEAVAAIGGSIRPTGPGQEIADADVIVDGRGSSANNPESAYWSQLSHRFALRFLDLPEPVLAKLAASGVFERVTARASLLPGLDRNIATVARSGLAIFARADMPEADAYAVARAVDAHQAGLKWFVGSYFYEGRRAWRNGPVPLHPGAERYYRAAGYME